jgi:type I restriction enzyme S subunit
MKNSDAGIQNSEFNIQNSQFSLPRYPRYRDSGVEWLGEIPAHWEVCRNLGVFDERKECNQPEAEMLSVTVSQGIIRQSEITTKKDSSNEDKSKYKVVRVGDLAYNKMRAWQGALGISDYDGIVSPAYVVLSPRNRKLSKYFHYLYRTPQFITEANRLSYGLCDDMNSLRYEHFKTSYSPLPPDEETNRIVAFLDRKTAEIDTLISKKQRQIELLDEQKAILINRAVTRGIVNSEFGMRNEHLSSSSNSTFTTHNSKFKPSGIDWIGDIPQHWEVKRIGHLGKVGNGSTPSRSNPQYWNHPDYPWLNSGSVNRNVITEADQFVTNLALRECHLPLVKERSIVVAITGQGKTRGTAALLMIPATINQHLAYIEIQTPTALPEFVHLSLTSQYFQLRAISESGSTKGALTCQDVKEFKIALPPVDEQRAIISTTGQIQKELATLAAQFDSQMKSLQTLRSTLIAAAVTGRIKV